MLNLNQIKHQITKLEESIQVSLHNINTNFGVLNAAKSLIEKRIHLVILTDIKNILTRSGTVLEIEKYLANREAHALSLLRAFGMPEDVNIEAKSILNLIDIIRGESLL